MVGIKNIVIIGKAGSGKSTLANVLSRTEAFREDSSSVAEIWRTKDKEFEVKEEEREKPTKYRVIDTVGLGDTKLTKEKLSEKFEEEIGTYIDEGISQIFLVMEGRIDKETLTEFLWLNEYLFDNKALDYTTIVRTKFTDFRSKNKCQEDIKGLVTFFNDDNKENYEEIIKILEKEKVIHVNNDSLKLRQKSRKNLIDHLKNLIDEAPYKPKTIKWLDENYPLENERKKITVLDISKRELKGRLNLKGFANLKRLNCSDNQLTSLDLSDCSNLIELKCNNNQLTNLNFLKSVANLEKLEIQDNKNLHPQSLKVLEDLNKLEELNINNTDLVEGWKCLIKNCRKLYCNSEKITEELDKKNCSNDNEDEKKYYNLDQWRETDKQNNLTASVIPLERLFVIRSNLKKFVDKWGMKKDEKDNGIKKYITWPYDKISGLWKKDEKLSELSKLSHPDDFNKQWLFITGIQWTNRATSVVGGSLLLVGTSRSDDQYTETGGIIAIVAPFVETVTSYLNDKVYEIRQKKWDEFIEDTKNMLDNYHELLGTLEKIEISKLGEINKALERLDKVADSFLESYDIDNNETVSVFEIIEETNRKKLAEDLSKKDDEKENSQLSSIIKAIKELEDEITKYRQGATDQEKVEIKSKVKRKMAKQQETENQPENKGKEVVTETDNRDTAIAIDESAKSQNNDQLMAQTEVSPKGSK